MLVFIHVGFPKIILPYNIVQHLSVSYNSVVYSGPSEIGTQYNIPLYKEHSSRSQKFVSL